MRVPANKPEQCITASKPEGVTPFKYLGDLKASLMELYKITQSLVCLRPPQFPVTNVFHLEDECAIFLRQYRLTRLFNGIVQI